jgi:protein-tyrosine phosphatase
LARIDAEPEDVRTELHFHLLPGVDDGPRDEDDAVALARLAVADGTTRVVATPHAHAIAPGDVRARVAVLNARLAREGVPLIAQPGIELLPADVLRLRARDLEQIAQGPPPRRWVLLEAPLDSIDQGAVGDALAKLQSLRFGTLIAHPERSPGWWADPAALDRATAAGARLQVNASSLTGFHGLDAQRRALDLARAGRVAVLASDAHSRQRPPCLTAAIEILARHGVAGEALAGSHPAALVAKGLPPLAAEPLAA